MHGVLFSVRVVCSLGLHGRRRTSTLERKRSSPSSNRKGRATCLKDSVSSSASCGAVSVGFRSSDLTLPIRACPMRRCISDSLFLTTVRVCYFDYTHRTNSFPPNTPSRGKTQPYQRHDYLRKHHAEQSTAISRSLAGDQKMFSLRPCKTFASAPFHIKRFM